MPKKIVILTTGQPSTNPRMVKEYTALKSAGFEVKVFYSYWQAWASRADSVLFAGGEMRLEDFVMVGGSPSINKWLYTASRARQKINQFFYRKTGKRLVGAISRVAPYLINAAKSERADLYIAHNIGALPAAVIAAKKFNSKAGFDAEDFHRGDFKEWEFKQQTHVVNIEDKYIPSCDYVTTGSPLFAEAYKRLYPKKKFIAVNNVFSKKFLQSFHPSSNNSLKLFWFSQTVGPFRGIETVAKAMNLLSEGYNVELHLLGNISTGFDKQLLDLSSSKKIYFLPPVSPNDIFKIASQYDVGLSIEIPYCENKDFCLANKAFTYMLSGNCIIFSNTKAQIQFLAKYPDSGFIYESENEVQLAEIIKDLYINRDKLNKAKHTSLQLASHELNWENESLKLINLINQTLND